MHIQGIKRDKKKVTKKVTKLCDFGFLLSPFTKKAIILTKTSKSMCLALTCLLIKSSFMYWGSSVATHSQACEY